MILFYFWCVSIYSTFPHLNILTIFNNKHFIYSILIELPLPATPTEMVSRRKILSRSRDDLHMDSTFQQPEDEEDVWYQKDKFYKVSKFFLIKRILLESK